MYQLFQETYGPMIRSDWICLLPEEQKTLITCSDSLEYWIENRLRINTHHDLCNLDGRLRAIVLKGLADYVMDR